MSEQENTLHNTNMVESVKYALGGVASVEVIGAIAHCGLPGLIALGVGAGYVTFKHGPQTSAYIHDNFIAPLRIATGRPTALSKRSQTYDEPELIEDQDIIAYDDDLEDDFSLPQSHNQPFSTYLNTFTPSLNEIYLASLPDGTPIYSDAKGLCHVALAGATGSGKSNVMRLLMAQLCKAKANVLLLNPHYTRYDIEHNEDWTPFEPYLTYDPMECRKYDVIEHWLREAATVVLPRRLEKYAHSQPLGKPYFIVIDELPAIVDNVPEAPRYLAKILREGRKVGIFLITASQDFLVKTISPQGGGAIRDCYRTAIYGGGDATTAKILLDMPANQIKEDLLGKGTVMLRSKTTKQATIAHVPYMDNKALYMLLGPSTYSPNEDNSDNEDFSDMWDSVPYPEPEVRASGPVPKITPRYTSVLSPELQMALNEYQPGMSYRDFGRALGIGKDKAGDIMRELKERRFIV